MPDTFANTIAVPQDSLYEARDTVSVSAAEQEDMWVMSHAVADGLRVEAIRDSLSASEAFELRSGKEDGLAGTSLPAPYIDSTPLTAAMVGVLLLGGLNAGSMRRGLEAYRGELWSVRRRPNVFDSEHAVPLVASIVYALIFVVFSGIVLYNLYGRPQSPTFVGVAAAMGVMTLYYILQVIVYSWVGYTFAADSARHRFLGGFKASQAFAGLGLVVPAILLVLYPEWRSLLITISLSIYGLARLIFVAKGVRIFYEGIGSLLYFILYLCTLEILPALFLYRLSSILWSLSL